MWSDVDTRRDYLNYLEVAEAVAEILLNPAMRPVSVGIFGTWGTGKSTILNLIEVRVLEEACDKVLVVRFDAWLYQGYDDARAALMEVIARALYAAAEKDESWLDKAKSFLARVNTMRALGLGMEVAVAAHGLPMFGAGARAVGGLQGIWKGEPTEEGMKAVADGGAAAVKLLDPKKIKTPPQEIHAFRQEFRELLDGLDRTLIVFVDNLDRCLPPQTIHTLEALRLFLFMDRSAFVVAADEEMVRSAVGHHFRDASQRHITDYLDKLIQVPVRVPRLGVAEIRAYLFMLFAEAEGVDAESLDQLRARLEENLRLSWKQSPISIEDVVAVLGSPSSELRQSFEIADRIAYLLATSSSVRGNPRIVKRMLNAVRLRSRIAKRRGIPINEELVAKFALFERCVPPGAVDRLYALINDAPGGKPGEITALEQATDEPSKFDAACPAEWKEIAPFLRDWLALKPALAGVDLRPLVYLSRETATLRAQSLDLSQTAADAARRLASTRVLASPVAKAAIASIPAGEHAGVMRELISKLRTNTDWSSKPDGFTGAQLLADQNVEAAELLTQFLSGLPGAAPPWLSAALRERAWFKGG